MEQSWQALSPSGLYFPSAHSASGFGLHDRRGGQAAPSVLSGPHIISIPNATIKNFISLI